MNSYGRGSLKLGHKTDGLTWTNGSSAYKILKKGKHFLFWNALWRDLNTHLNTKSKSQHNNNNDYKNKEIYLKRSFRFIKYVKHVFVKCLG